MTTISDSRSQKKIFRAIFVVLPLIVLCFAGLGRAARAPEAAAKAKTRGQKAGGPFRKSPAKRIAAKPVANPAAERLRDPFSIPKPAGTISGVLNESADEMAHPCPSGVSGTRCLVIGQLHLEGIARIDGKKIAVLANPAHRAYFLHENDPLSDGTLTRITPDTVYFTEEYHDPATGKVEAREVEKKMAPTPGEKK